MGATASLDADTVAVEPGAQVSCELKVRNTGTVVDQFTFSVRGEAAAWASVEPPTLSLFPDAEGTARVTFQPTRSIGVRAGPVPFAVRAASREDPGGDAVVEAVVEVLPFADTTAELVPRTSHGRQFARHNLAFDNRGNQPVVVHLAASDPDGLLAFQVSPAVLEVPPGAAGFAAVRVRARGPLWRGSPQTIPFQVTATPAGGQPIPPRVGTDVPSINKKGGGGGGADGGTTTTTSPGTGPLGAPTFGRVEVD